MTMTSGTTKDRVKRREGRQLSVIVLNLPSSELIVGLLEACGIITLLGLGPLAEGNTSSEWLGAMELSGKGATIDAEATELLLKMR
jgi:hypothetical protein